MYNSSFTLLHKFCICEAAEVYETRNFDYGCLAYLCVTVKEDKTKTNFEVFFTQEISSGSGSCFSLFKFSFYNNFTFQSGMLHVSFYLCHGTLQGKCNPFSKSRFCYDHNLKAQEVQFL